MLLFICSEIKVLSINPKLTDAKELPDLQVFFTPEVFFSSQHSVELYFREELCSFQREIEVLSEQYSQKCLENAHLAQALEAERQALRQCQRENQELNAHNQVPTETHTAHLSAQITVL